MEKNGWEGFPDLMTLLLNQAMKIQREHHMGAGWHERSPHRVDHANGFKSKTMKTRMGLLNLSVPQTRNGGFYPSILERGVRSERALMLAVAEMYVSGVSTRKVRKITEELCGMSISSTQVSRLTALMDQELSLWRQRPLDEIPFLILDAHYEKVRHDGSVMDLAVLKAVGIRKDGRKTVLGVSVSLSEAEVHWRAFLESLTARGIKGIRMVISDDHAGLKAARKAALPGVRWQRCVFHLMQNAQSHCAKKSMIPKLMSELEKIYTAPDKGAALQRLKALVASYAKTAPDLARWIEADFIEGLTFFDFPEPFWKKTRTSNLVENLNKQVRKRTNVCGLFPNADSALRLISAVLMDLSESWETGKRHFKCMGLLDS
jgi:transposase-like protein